MGQANAARDKLYDLRECDLSGARGNEYDLSGVIMTRTDASNAKFREAQFSKGYLRDSNSDGADITNAIVERADFKGSTLRGTIFNNAVLTATSFEGANVENADFTGKFFLSFFFFLGYYINVLSFHFFLTPFVILIYSILVSRGALFIQMHTLVNLILGIYVRTQH